MSDVLAPLRILPNHATGQRSVLSASVTNPKITQIGCSYKKELAKRTYALHNPEAHEDVFGAQECKCCHGEAMWAIIGTGPVRLLLPMYFSMGDIVHFTVSIEPLWVIIL